MPKSLQAQRYRRLPGFLRKIREEAGMTQRDLAKKLRLNHTLIHNSETAERRVDVAEFCDWAVACGLEPLEAFADFLKFRKS
jgi:transcriptional regulator with XRE-family HTH domain